MKVGDYVRTKSYGIAKILTIYNNTTTNYSSITLDKIDSFGGLSVSITLDNIIGNPSENPINLIKEGDLVNNHIVGQVLYEYQTIDKIKYLDLQGVNMLVCNDDIKSIVTKEQFERIEYRVGE